MFMPVGTYGAIKGVTTQQLLQLDCHTILGNTYHLGQRPTTPLIDQMGGLHNFMQWPRGLLTDSGGFQMVSLLELAKVEEEGVTFRSPTDGSMMLLTPEKSIQMQNEIGADVIMALDDVISSQTTGERVEEAMHRTLRWIDRCIAAHKKPHAQNLFGIVQGGLDPELRRYCTEQMIKRNLPGYAIGGLSGGEEKSAFWRVVKLCCELLPQDKPRYLMGVGYPVDLVVCSALGVDMFDCVFPCRTARFGMALIDDGGSIQLKQKMYASDTRPIEPGCDCSTCQTLTRAYLHTVAAKETVGARLITIHNISYMMRLMRRVRKAIGDGVLPVFVQEFMGQQFPDKNYPAWVVEALASVHILLKN